MPALGEMFEGLALEAAVEPALVAVGALVEDVARAPAPARRLNLGWLVGLTLQVIRLPGWIVAHVFRPRSRRTVE